MYQPNYGRYQPRESTPYRQAPYAPYPQVPHAPYPQNSYAPYPPNPQQPYSQSAYRPPMNAPRANALPSNGSRQLSPDAEAAWQAAVVDAKIAIPAYKNAVKIGDDRQMANAEQNVTNAFDRLSSAAPSRKASNTLQTFKRAFVNERNPNGKMAVLHRFTVNVLMRETAGLAVSALIGLAGFGTLAASVQPLSNGQLGTVNEYGTEEVVTPESELPADPGEVTGYGVDQYAGIDYSQAVGGGSGGGFFEMLGGGF